MFYSILVDGKLQTTCTNLKNAIHIAGIYEEKRIFPGKEIRVVEDDLRKRPEWSEETNE